VFYGQYDCYGPGSDTRGRVDWAMELTYEQAKPFMTTDFIDGNDWL
jgi:pectinesterase